MKRIYLVELSDESIQTNPRDWDDEEFVSKSEEQGNVYSLKGFEEDFNSELIHTPLYYMRIINIEE